MYKFCFERNLLFFSICLPQRTFVLSQSRIFCKCSLPVLRSRNFVTNASALLCFLEYILELPSHSVFEGTAAFNIFAMLYALCATRHMTSSYRTQLPSCKILQKSSNINFFFKRSMDTSKQNIKRYISPLNKYERIKRS